MYFKAQMTACTRARMPGGCTTTALALQVGFAGDPEFCMRHKLFLCWFNIKRSCPEHRDLLTRAWAHLRPVLCRPDRWRRVSGLLCAVVSSLYDIGWKPIASFQWDGNTHEPTELDRSDPSFEDVLCDHLKKCLGREVWKRAADFRHGKGFSEGAGWTTIFCHRR